MRGRTRTVAVVAIATLVLAGCTEDSGNGSGGDPSATLSVGQPSDGATGDGGGQPTGTASPDPSGAATTDDGGTEATGEDPANIVAELNWNGDEWHARLDDVDAGSICSISDGDTIIDLVQGNVRFKVATAAGFAVVYTDTSAGSAGYRMDLELATENVGRSVQTDIYVLMGAGVADDDLDDDVTPSEPLLALQVQVACGPEAHAALPDRA